LKTLFLIPARLGSKGLPGKNTKLLGDKALISYSIEFALNNKTENDTICISTNDENIFPIAKTFGLEVPFIRPAELCTDTASSYDVILHAIHFYEQQNYFFDRVLLLQPTSPFRTDADFSNLMSINFDGLDMVVSVKECKENPYFNLFEETKDAFLTPSKVGNFSRRQDCPLVYAFNGSMYLINVQSIKKEPIYNFKNIKKIVMPESRSVDIDTPLDWQIATFYLSKQ
jgi:CMP-N,N'-diacetyllegionaminic acid synthase